MLTYEDGPAEDPQQLFADLDHEAQPWYLAVLHRDSDPPLNEYTRTVNARYGLERVPSESPILWLYVHKPSATPEA